MSNPEAERTQRSIQDICDEVAHVLPQQAPLHTFVHHNTLHVFEDKPFEHAVETAARVFDAEPYLTEAEFLEQIQSGRIQPQDIDVAVEECESDAAILEREIAGGMNRRHFRSKRLRHLFEIPSSSALPWLVDESDVLRAPYGIVSASRRRALRTAADRYYPQVAGPRRMRSLLGDLWAACAQAAADLPAVPAAQHVWVRRRDQILALHDVDVDLLVHPLLIRMTAAFLDQGIAHWQMPNREKGFLGAVRDVFCARLPAPDPFSRALAMEFEQQAESGANALATIEEMLGALGVAESQREVVIRATLLSLPGWAGMVRQFEERPDRAPVDAVAASLIDFLAVQLTMDTVAARLELRRLHGSDANWELLTGRGQAEDAPDPLTWTFEAFVMAQIVNLDPALFLDRENAATWVAEVRSYGSMDRRRTLQIAYERRLRMMLLDGLLVHDRKSNGHQPEPRFQAVFCIDERECSTRRHLEEHTPECETFGYAGFFGVPMAWRALDEERPRPLCPVNVTPRHVVTERALDHEELQAWIERRRRRGITVRRLISGNRTIALGGVVSAVAGLWSVIPMIGRCLTPRLSERLAHNWMSAGLHPPLTRLVFEKESEELDDQGRCHGFTVEEMADIVEALVRTVAMNRSYCDLVLMVGHGSSSLNNPHEAAHDCGATGGGRGGPNARTFAAMANHQGVRAQLIERGLEIPTTTWFLGAYHNTCDDDVLFYDLDLLPETHQDLVDEARSALRAASQLEAHERCRRFESAPKNGDVERAMWHVQARATDLAQPRPEYGHATNAYTIVGRRSRTRGLFLDRRAFLCSYDPTSDETGQLLENLLGAVIPVCAGINLEYYFSYVDPVRYGCGTKLPHNITGLIGVMNGHSSDLRTGLPWQMVEIHEPVRLLVVVEAHVDRLRQAMDARPEVRRLIENRWVQLAAWNPEAPEIRVFRGGEFVLHDAESTLLPEVDSSADCYRHSQGHLPCAHILAGDGGQMMQHLAGGEK